MSRLRALLAVHQHSNFHLAMMHERHSKYLTLIAPFPLVSWHRARTSGRHSELPAVNVVDKAIETS